MGFTLVSARPLTGTIESYDAPATEEIARRVGLPVAEIVRFDVNTSPQVLPSTRGEPPTEELGRIRTYPHGGYPQLERAIADYAGVAPENVVLGAGAEPARNASRSACPCRSASLSPSRLNDDTLPKGGSDLWPAVALPTRATICLANPSASSRSWRAASATGSTQ
jgi:hypothetical protein